MSEQIIDGEVIGEDAVGPYLGKFPNHVEGEIVEGENITGYFFDVPNGVKAAWLYGNDRPSPSAGDMQSKSSAQTPPYKTDLITLIIICICIIVAIPVLFLFFAPN